jgi:hypothetical protein
MDGLKRILRVLLPAAVLVAGTLASTSNTASAYGAADRPLAQLEFSGNCNNPTYSLCQQVGLGGIWIWIEIDAAGDGDIAGAGCGHVRGVGGGGGPIKGEITWSYATLAQAIGAGAFVLGIDPGNQYYLVPLGPGEAFAFPTTVGHYSFHPAPAVALETQVAPSGKP